MKKLSIIFSIVIILTLAFTFKPAQAAEGRRSGSDLPLAQIPILINVNTGLDANMGKN